MKPQPPLHPMTMRYSRVPEPKGKTNSSRGQDVCIYISITTSLRRRSLPTGTRNAAAQMAILVFGDLDLGRRGAARRGGVHSRRTRAGNRAFFRRRYALEIHCNDTRLSCHAPRIQRYHIFIDV